MSVTTPLPEQAAGPVDAVDLIYGVAPVLEVPFTADGAVDENGFAAVVDAVLGTSVTAVMFPGFASEFHKLSDPERAALTEILLDRTRHRDDVAAVVAVQDHAVRLAVDRAAAAIDAGADAINLLPPHFLTPGADQVIEHLRAVLSAISPAPVVFQYAPKETGVLMTPQMLTDVAATHPNLRMVKVESSPPGGLIGELAAATPSLPAIEGYAGVQLPDAFRRGAVGTQPGCSFIEIYQQIWACFAAGDLAAGDALHAQLLPFISYWMLDTELIIAAEKHISMRRGWFASDHCRQPGHRLDAEEIAMIDRFFGIFGDMLNFDA